MKNRPGAELAERLLASLSEAERHDISRWELGSAEAEDYLTGYLQGRFYGNGHSLIALANAARAIADREVTI